MYKNFTLTESEKEQILNMHKDKGYRQPLNEQPTGENKVVSCSSLGIKTIGYCDVQLKKPVKPCAELGVKTIGYCYVDTKNPVSGIKKEPINEGLGLLTGQECYMFGEVYVCVGDKSEYVMNLQKQLNQSNCQKGLPPISLDGVFGPETKERIQVNQKSNCKVPGFNTQQYKRIKTPTGEKYVPVKVSGTNIA